MGHSGQPYVAYSEDGQGYTPSTARKLLSQRALILLSQRHTQGSHYCTVCGCVMHLGAQSGSGVLLTYQVLY